MVNTQIKKPRDLSEFCPTVGDLAKALRERSTKKISGITVQRRLRERNIKKCAKTKKPFVSTVNRRKRVEFARRHRDWTIEEWKKVLWADESPYCIRSQTRQYVWRTPQEKSSPRCLRGTVKHQKKIMAWGCFSWYGVGALYHIKGILNKEKYRQIVIHHMRPSARRLQGDDFVFQHDNDPKHTSHLVDNYLQNQQIQVLTWPP